MNKEELSSYFRQVVRDCIRELKHYGHSYCFTEDQVECIKEELPQVMVNEIDGMFSLNYSGSFR